MTIRKGGCIKPISAIEVLANIAYAHLQEQFVALDNEVKNRLEVHDLARAYEKSIWRAAIAHAAISVKARLLREDS